ncbi:putative cell wall protein [Sesbania bispinosa]|nr:putative cell wall protein [Sesbania bispinosa]
MAHTHRASPFLALLLISNILLVTTWQAVAARSSSISKNSNTQDKKEPEWLFKHDGRVEMTHLSQTLVLKFPFLAVVVEFHQQFIHELTHA